MISAQLLLIFGLTAILIFFFGLQRALLLWFNRELAKTVPSVEIVRAFFIGMRFDLVVIGAVMLLPILLQCFPGGTWRLSFSVFWVTGWGSLLLLLGVIELEFYRQFHTRLNSLVVDYLKEDPKTVTSMIWHGCPVLSYLGLWLIGCGLLWGGCRLLGTFSLALFHAAAVPGLPRQLVFFLPLTTLDAIACRGTLRSGPPLRWGDAYHSTHLFANHLALNGIFTMIKAVIDSRRKKSRSRWLKVMDPTTARETTRALLLQNGDEADFREEAPIRRLHRPVPNRLGLKNVVVILMESFSASFIGALGHPGRVSPEFDRLCAEGLLFDHFFSCGTHTHQGIFATLAGFPNLPGFETLMQQPQGAAAFSGLGNQLSQRGYDDVYIYNGDFAWDNQEGFFRNQGMTRFIGRYDYKNPEFIDPTWGVSDHDMFNRAHLELCRYQGGKPFFAVLQTLSNHLPFTIPEPLPMARVSGYGALDGHLTAMKYADWALGRFFDQARKAPYYHDTLFVLVGDHGFCAPRQLTDIELLRFHIPLLLLAPGLREKFGPRRSLVGSQIDVVPTILGLLEQPFAHQGWGRNLLQTAADDPGFAVIKPSGSDPSVALVRGEKIFVKPPAGRVPQLYDYQLYPEGRATPVSESETAEMMETDLNAYIQTAMQALISGRTGI
ncbi:MAG TPA: alkaline phosphatase family protein [Proteobacteria bacterium]|nr:alkaline phosphatase family protein [Pseudomonadota bacterium]